MSIRVALAGLFTIAALPALAADYISYGSDEASYALRPAVHDWSGGYAGVHGGWNWSEYSASGALGGVPFQLSRKTDGSVVGVQSGYGVQLDDLYFGIEADLSHFDRKIGSGWATLSSPWQGSFRGRVGMAFDDALVYATGGIAAIYSKARLGGLTDTETTVGWTAGAGAELRLGVNWSARGEYLYSSFRERYAAHAFLTEIRPRLESHVIRAGLNYQFGE